MIDLIHQSLSFGDDMKIMFVSLGCDKNLVDTEMMLGMLSEKGYSFTDDENEADIVVVNTCCFIGDAKEESINQLLAYGEKKTTGHLKGLIATGCLAQRYAKEIREDIPEVDVIVGTNAIDQIIQAIEAVTAHKRTDFLRDINDTPVFGKKRMVTSGSYSSYCRRMRQALYILHHSQGAWQLPQRADGRAGTGSQRFSGAGRKGADTGSTGNNPLR